MGYMWLIEGCCMLKFRFLVFHVAFLLATVWVSPTVPAVVLGVFLYWLRMFGVTAGYHRYFSHRTFKTSRVFAFILACLAQSSAQRGVIWWASNHRHHHRFSDKLDDLHSPVTNTLLHAHVGWLWDKKSYEDRENARDLEKLNMKIIWKGTGLNEVGYDVLNKKKIILVDKNYIRPLDVNTLLGNAAKARRELKWKPQINIHTLIDEMITEEMNILSNDQ